MGFSGVPCIKCGEVDQVNVALCDGSLGCELCNETWTRDDVEALVGAWTRVLAWLDKMPSSDEGK